MSEAIILNERYQLEEQLGSGGMAVVYRAMDLMLERPVAIKVLRSTYSQDEDFRERFRQEARAAANLSHPNIVTVHDFGLDRGRLFIVMEFVPGAHLKDLLRRRGRFPITDSIDLMVQACAGVGYAHRAGIVHCDIKPHNILITPDLRVKVTDFGIAQQRWPRSSRTKKAKLCGVRPNISRPSRLPAKRPRRPRMCILLAWSCTRC